MKELMNTYRILMAYVWASLALAAGLYLLAIASYQGLNPQLQYVFGLLVVLFSTVFMLALKLGRIQGKVLKLK